MNKKFRTFGRSIVIFGIARRIIILTWLALSVYSCQEDELTNAWDIRMVVSKIAH